MKGLLDRAKWTSGENLEPWYTFMMKIFRVILPVRDLDQATIFYKGLLAQEGKRVSPGRHYFDCEGTILACYDPRADGDDYDATPNPDHVYFSTVELDEVYKRAQSLGCREISEIELQPWGERSFYLKDPFNNPLCFVDSATLFTGS
jgi:uncharacterized glyoxalase superfamily protein PhnB